MGNAERSRSGDRSNWPVTIGGMVGGAAGGAVALFVVRPLVELPFWLGPIAFCAMFGAGIVLGRLVGGLLSRPAGRRTSHPTPDPAWQPTEHPCGWPDRHGSPYG
jgi:hypothetical protein